MWRVVYRTYITAKSLCPYHGTNLRYCTNVLHNKEGETELKVSAFGSNPDAFGRLQEKDLSLVDKHPSLSVVRSRSSSVVKSRSPSVDKVQSASVDKKLSSSVDKNESPTVNEHVSVSQFVSKLDQKSLLHPDKAIELYEQATLNSLDNAAKKPKKEIPDKIELFPSQTKLTNKSTEAVTFGKLAKYEGDAGDKKQIKHDEDSGRDKESKEYWGKHVKSLVDQKKLKEAVDLLEVEMPAGKIKPRPYYYSLVMAACSHHGFIEKTFSLYRRMKDIGLPIKEPIYTSLLAACSNANDKTVGLSQTKYVMQEMKSRGVQPNSQHYHTMIKSLGRNGDLPAAFTALDEMANTTGLGLDPKSINYILQACVYDNNTGFRHAMMMWWRMRAMRMKPDIITYNMLLRCTLECKAGDPLLFEKLLQDLTVDADSIMKPPKKKKKKKTPKLEGVSSNPGLLAAKHEVVGNIGDEKTNKNISQISPNPDIHQSAMDSSSSIDIASKYMRERQSVAETTDLSKPIDVASKALETTSSTNAPPPPQVVEDHNTSDDSIPSALPKLLAKKPNKGLVVTVSDLSKPHHRLSLLNGCNGFLHQMSMDGIMPDLKTFRLLMRASPPDVDAEEAILQTMAQFNVTPDISFVNMLIKKRADRYAFDDANDALQFVTQYELQPNITTFQYVAKCCRNYSEAKQLLTDMDNTSQVPNLALMKNLVCTAVNSDQYGYTLYVLSRMAVYELQPDSTMVAVLETARHRALDFIRKLERKKEGLNNKEQKLVDMRRTFLLEYKRYLQGSKLARMEPELGYFRRE